MDKDVDKLTFLEWVKRFEEKAEPFVEDEGYSTVFSPYQGFFQFRFDGDVFRIGNVCTANVQWVHDACYMRAKMAGCKELATWTHRNPKAFLRLMRKLGYEVHLDVAKSGVGKNGLFYWYLTEVVKP